MLPSFNLGKSRNDRGIPALKGEIESEELHARPSNNQPTGTRANYLASGNMVSSQCSTIMEAKCQDLPEPLPP